MARVAFTPNLQRILECPSGEAPGNTVGEVLAAAFHEHPRVQTYVLDDQGALRKHVMVFLNGQQIADRRRLSDAVADGDEIFVMQALSGG